MYWNFTDKKQHNYNVIMDVYFLSEMISFSTIQSSSDKSIYMVLTRNFTSVLKDFLSFDLCELHSAATPLWHIG